MYCEYFRHYLNACYQDEMITHSVRFVRLSQSLPFRGNLWLRVNNCWCHTDRKGWENKRFNKKAMEKFNDLLNLSKVKLDAQWGNIERNMRDDEVLGKKILMDKFLFQ